MSNKEIENNEEKDNNKINELVHLRSNYSQTLSISLLVIFMLVLSLASLNTITSRQSSLSDHQVALSNLQEKLSSTMLLTIESKKNISSVDDKLISSINYQNIKDRYSFIESDINNMKQHISYGYQKTIFEKYDNTKSIIELLITLKYFSSDTLLGILLISCGIIGAITSAIRENKKQLGRIIILGASVGFVTLLGIKGGSTIFILNNTGVDIPFNAYSTAFIGIIAGMFSEKFYLLLSNVTDKVVEDNKD